MQSIFMARPQQLLQCLLLLINLNLYKKLSTYNIYLHPCTGAICQIKPTSGCRAYFRNFYFNLKTKKCEEIIAGGCHPSGWNGFTTMEECNSTCLGNVSPKRCINYIFLSFLFYLYKSEQYPTGNMQANQWFTAALYLTSIKIIGV